MAEELHRMGALGTYYSGYPAWKLGGSSNLSVRSHSFRTLVTYAMLGRVPERFRPSHQTLFRWQDDGFDRWVSKVLQRCDFLHGIPGQCRESFRRAQQMGIRTVLNHATGPAAQVARMLQPEYDRLGLTASKDGGFDADYLSRIEEEFGLADFHCCASSVVRDQLIAGGVDGRLIWVVPYGADPAVWNPGPERKAKKADNVFRIMFAGQVSLRKGMHYLLSALEMAGKVPWQLDVYGPLLEETRLDRQTYSGTVPVCYHGAISQSALAQAMRESDLLVLPSLEEGFGLVVVQALACGLPCVVSSIVGAKDLITEEQNGSIFAVKNIESILAAIRYWAGERRRVSGNWGWAKPAAKLLALSQACVARTAKPLK